MRVTELSGFALDWAVYQALREGKSLIPADLVYTREEFYEWWDQGYRRYSSEFNVAGPIIHQHGISVVYMHPGRWAAFMSSPTEYFGGTPQEAAMRCYVASKFGEEVPDSNGN